MDLSVLIKQRLGQLGLDQKDLAEATQVTESYISQLLAGKKTPPSPSRTDIYEKIGEFLGLGAESRSLPMQRRHDLKRKIDAPAVAGTAANCCCAPTRGMPSRGFRKGTLR
jgi:transcriptional regulator with XRE-family HTH domain